MRHYRKSRKSNPNNNTNNTQLSTYALVTNSNNTITSSEAVQTSEYTVDLTYYEYKKNDLLNSYRRMNEVKGKDIAELAVILEQSGYPLESIVAKIIADLSNEISPVVILKHIPQRYIRAALNSSGRVDRNNHVKIEDSYMLHTLQDIVRTAENLQALCNKLIGHLEVKSDIRIQLERDEDVIRKCSEIQGILANIKSEIQDIKKSKEQDFRVKIDDLALICMHLLKLTHSYRYIGKIFGVNVKWAKIILNQKDLSKLPSVKIRLDRDVKKGEEIDILPYALNLIDRKAIEE